MDRKSGIGSPTSLPARAQRGACGCRRVPALRCGQFASMTRVFSPLSFSTSAFLSDSNDLPPRGNRFRRGELRVHSEYFPVVHNEGQQVRPAGRKRRTRSIAPLQREEEFHGSFQNGTG